jgi:O-antigen/teichoic acid export membrane protein
MLRTLRHRASGHRHLLTGSAALVVTAGVQAISGALFWLLAARSDSQTDVGHATALYTSVLFVAFVAGLGQPVAVARYAAGRTRDDHVLYAWATAATTAAGAAIGLGYLYVVSPAAVDELREWDPTLGPALFAFFVVGTGLSLLVDVRLMTQRRWGLVVLRATVVAVLRFPLLALPIDSHRSLWLFVAAIVPTALSGVVVTGLLPLITGDRHRFGPVPASTRAMVRYSGVNWLSTLAYQAPTFAMPVIVLVNVDADVNASFYVAWGIVGLAGYVPMAIGQALLAEGGRDGAQVRSQVRLAVVVAGGLMVVGTILATGGRQLIATLYGDDYQAAADVLPPLVAASIPWAVTSVYLTEARIRHFSGATIAITVTLTVTILGSALYLVPRHGLDGAAWAYLGGNSVAAVVAFGTHWVGRRAYDEPPTGPRPGAMGGDEIDADDVMGVAPLT